MLGHGGARWGRDKTVGRGGGQTRDRVQEWGVPRNKLVKPGQGMLQDLRVKMAVSNPIALILSSTMVTW